MSGRRTLMQWRLRRKCDRCYPKNFKKRLLITGKNLVTQRGDEH